MDTFLKWFMRLNKVEIDNNRECGAAEVKLVSTVATVMPGELTPAPDLAELVDQVKQIFSDRRVIEVDHIHDGHKFTFGDTGLIVAVRPEIPLMINWNLALIEKDSDVRRIGKEAEEFLDESAIVSAAERIISLTTVNPVWPVAFTVVKALFGQLAHLLAGNKDDMICLYQQDLMGWMDYPHGDRKAEGVPTIEGNGRVSYSMFGFKGEVPA